MKRPRRVLYVFDFLCIRWLSSMLIKHCSEAGKLIQVSLVIFLLVISVQL